MADSAIPVKESWQKVRRQHRAARFSPVIRIRKNGQIAISSDFARMADISDCTHATLYIDGSGLRLAIDFHSNSGDDDAFYLCRDGGRSTGRSEHHRVINCKALLSQSLTMRAIVREDVRVRQYEPQRDCSGKWIINIAPCFECVWNNGSKAIAASSGIYRYRRGEDIVYIGRGIFCERLSESDRRNWDFDIIEYSILNDDVLERRWETFWLDEYRKRNGRWPIYNRVAGVATIVSTG